MDSVIRKSLQAARETLRGEVIALEKDMPLSQTEIEVKGVRF